MNKTLSTLALLFRTLAVLALFQFATTLHASRVKDLTAVEGGRDNQLVGYGLVFGLAGDGDSNAASTLRAVSNTLQRHGITVSQQDIKAKNVAAVMVTADIGAFLKPGARIDITVASMGDAKRARPPSRNNIKPAVFRSSCMREPPQVGMNGGKQVLSKYRHVTSPESILSSLPTHGAPPARTG
jgi:hypothetical protein